MSLLARFPLKFEDVLLKEFRLVILSLLEKISSTDSILLVENNFFTKKIWINYI